MAIHTFDNKDHIKSIETGHLTSCANGQLLRDMLASTLRRKKTERASRTRGGKRRHIQHNQHLYL